MKDNRTQISHPGGRFSEPWSGHKKLESKVRYLDIKVDDALAIIEV